MANVSFLRWNSFIRYSIFISLSLLHNLYITRSGIALNSIFFVRLRKVFNFAARIPFTTLCFSRTCALFLVYVFVHTFRLRTRIEFVTRSRIEVYTNVGIPMYLRKHTRATRPFTYPQYRILLCSQKHQRLPIWSLPSIFHVSSLSLSLPLHSLSLYQVMSKRVSRI